MGQGRGRTAAAAIAMLALCACGREGTWPEAAVTVAAPAPESPSPSPSPEPTAKPAPTPEPTSEPAPPVAAAAPPAAPRPTQAIPSTDLPEGPDGEDDTKRDSGVRGRVMAGDRPVADAVVFVKGEAYQSNSTTGPGGRFHIHAPSGTYVVGARANNASVRCEDETVKVDETRFTTVSIECHT